MIYRVYVEKKKEYAGEAKALLSELRELIGIKGLTDLRLLNRYDVENIDDSLFETCKTNVFSEPALDEIRDEIPAGYDAVFAVEYLPGQFDQRADSAAQCIQIISQKERPNVATAKVYLLYGNLTVEEIAAIKNYVINPVECREASLEKPETLEMTCEIPADVAVLEGFLDLEGNALDEWIRQYGLAMDRNDLICCRDYFRSEGRCPTVTELRVLDTYWSDHCRHTTFSTEIDKADIQDKDVEKAYEAYLQLRREAGRNKPVTLMDIATIGARTLSARGKLDSLDRSEEVNACTVKIKADVDGRQEDWLLLFKNETHNHPTEIEPFGGAATCIGGAIRDPLSGRGYVYQAMRVTGAGDPTAPIEDTLEGKLPQRTIVNAAAAGYSSYGNQIGLATGLVDEIYHPGYIAKRMEVGAVIAAAPKENVRRETPAPGDRIVLLGGRTGRDGCGGATGSSKSHDSSSLTSCGAEVQKGNAPEERKLQRLFRNGEAAKMIKRCNDFGAGGVSVAIGELADGLNIDLDQVLRKYEGLDGTELAISESQERMAVVLGKEDVDAFLKLAEQENLEARVVAEVQEDPRIVIKWRGKTIVDLSRAFLNTNGAQKHTNLRVEAGNKFEFAHPYKDSLKESMRELADDLNVCSKRGLTERFDSTIGAGTVLMPFGGKYQKTPAQAMVSKIPLLEGETTTCSAMAYGFNPYISEKDPYAGAYLAVVESVAKLLASGGTRQQCWLSFQEYFEKLGSAPEKWGKPFSALLGALKAQMDLEVAAIGGKDSMSGSFESIHVPPTLISFAVSVCENDKVVSPEFKQAGSRVVWLAPEYDGRGLPSAESLIRVFDAVAELTAAGKVRSAYTPGYGGAAEGIYKMGLGNRIGFRFDDGFAVENAFSYGYGSFLLELAEDAEPVGVPVGVTLSDWVLEGNGETVSLEEIEAVYDARLESVYPCNAEQTEEPLKTFVYEKRGARKASGAGIARPKVLIPVFPGTNCEYDTARAFEDAGAKAEIVLVRNLTPGALAETAEVMRKQIESSQIIMLPGGFSGGDEPDGSGKFIAAFFRNPALTEAIHEFLNKRDGLMAGICNGFQALIKMGLVPYGKISEADESFPTLAPNLIGRHQSKLIRTRIASVKSPWLSECEVGEIHTMAISHGEGRFVCSRELLDQLAENGQIATQYVDEDGSPTMEIQYNPNGSYYAVEGITSPDGRIFGKMGHTERMLRPGLYKNVCTPAGNGMFKSAVKYFK